MSQPLTAASLKDLIRFPFREPDWKNRFLIGSGLILASYFIPILPLIFVCGYYVDVTRRVIRGEEPSLPAWSDWGRLGVDGLRAMLVGFVYLLPGTLVYTIGMTLYIGGSMIIPFTANNDSSPLFFLGFMALFTIFMLSLALAMVLFILGGIPLPLAVAHFVAKDRVGAAFRVSEWWRVLRANKLGFFIDWVIVAGFAAIIYLGYMVVAYTVVLCCLLPFLFAPAFFYLVPVAAAKFAQSYREGAEPNESAAAEAA